MSRFVGEDREEKTRIEAGDAAAGATGKWSIAGRQLVDRRTLLGIRNFRHKPERGSKDSAAGLQS